MVRSFLGAVKQQQLLSSPQQDRAVLNSASPVGRRNLYAADDRTWRL